MRYSLEENSEFEINSLKKEIRSDSERAIIQMPNQKHRKKKAGVNKSKKVRAMRAKEALAKPAEKPSATGKRPGQTSKYEIEYDRPGSLHRA